MGDDAAMRYLLVSSEWHLPGRESHKYDPVGSQVVLQTRKEQLLVFDMFYYVVQKNQGKFRPLFGGRPKHVSYYELPFQLSLGKEGAGLYGA